MKIKMTGPGLGQLTKEQPIECPSCKETYFFNKMDDGTNIQFYANEKKNVHLRMSVIESSAEEGKFGLDSMCNVCHCRFIVTF